MKKKLLSLIALVAVAVGISFAVNYAPGNGLKFAGKADAEKLDIRKDFSSQVIKGLTNANEIPMQKKSVSTPKTAEEDWTEWEPFAPMGKSTCTWSTQWFDNDLVCEVYVRQLKTTATTKQFKFTNWGDDKAHEFIVKYDETAPANNNLSFEPQATGPSSDGVIAYFYDYAHAAVATNPAGYYYYTPETGKFVIKPWVAAINESTGALLGYYNGGSNISEECQMDGFADYSFGNILVTKVDDTQETETSVGEITFGITKIGADVAYWKAGISTMTAYQAGEGPVAGDTKYTDKATLVMPYDKNYQIVVIVAEAYDSKDSLLASSTKAVTATKASDWQSMGKRPYREDIVTPVYFSSAKGIVFDVEVEKNTKHEGWYRLKNPYGANSPFNSYCQYSNAYMYFSISGDVVTPYLSLYVNDLGFDAEAVAYGKPNPFTIEGSYCEDGTFDGYVITFPVDGLIYGDNEGAYYSNRDGLFRAVINFRDTEFAFADDAKSVYVDETVKITTNNSFNTPTYESITPEIATVDAKGVVTAIAPGKAQIKVKQDSILEFKAKEEVMEIDVKKNPNSFGTFVFNTDEGLEALGVEKPAASAATNLTGMTLTAGDVSFTSTDGGTATRVWNTKGVTDLRMYKNATFTISVPEGYKLVDIDFTGSECSLFGEVSDFTTCSKSHTVWEAPEGDPVTTKTFDVVGTCKINVIKVKYIQVASASGTVWDFTKLAPIAADGTGNLKNEIKDDGGSGWTNLQNSKAITDEELTISEGVPYEVTKGLKFTAGGSGWIHIRNYPEEYFGQQFYSNNKDLKVTVPATAGQYIIITALSPDKGVLAVKAMEGTDTTTINVCANETYIYQSKAGDVTFNLVKQLTIKKIEVVDALPANLWDFNTITASVADGTGNLKNNIVDDGGAGWTNHQNSKAITEEELTISEGVPYEVTKGLKFTAGGSGWIHIRNYPDEYNGKQFFSNNKDLKVTVPATAGQYIVFDAVSASGNTQIVCGDDTVDVYPGAVTGYMIQAKADNPVINIKKQLTIKKINVIDAAPAALAAGLKASIESNVLKVGDVAPITWSCYDGVTPIFASDNAEVATVDSKGNITAVSAGTANIVVTKKANAYYKEANVTIAVTVENAGPTELAAAIEQAIAGKTQGDTAVVTLDGKVAYTFEKPVDVGLVNIVINGNGALVTLSDSVQIAGQQGIEINNVNFDCAANTKCAPIALSANPDSVLVGAYYPVAEGETNNLRSKAFYDLGAIVINECNFSGVKTSWISANKREWNLKTLKIINTIAQFDVASGIDSYINWTGNSNNEGSIKDIVIEGSTLYNIVESNDNRFLRLQNNSNSQAQKAWAEPQFDAKESWVMTNNTFVNLPSNKEFANNYPNKNNVTLDFKGNIFYNTWRLQKISGSAIREFTAADNSIIGITNAVDNTDAASYATIDSLLISGEKPFVVPTTALDLTNPDLTANFTPYGLSYAAQNDFGDPRWKADVKAPGLALATDTIEVEGVMVKRPATWKFVENSNEVYQLAWTSLNPATPVFASSDEAVATVDAEGKITPVGVGYATITFAQEPTAEFKAASQEFVVMVAGTPEYPTLYADEDKDYTALNMCDIITTYSINGSSKYGLEAEATPVVTYYNPGAPIEVQTSNRTAYINPLTDEAKTDYVPTSTDGAITVAPVVGTQKTLACRIAKADSIKFYYTGSGGSSTTVTMWVLNEAGDTIATVEGGDAAGKNKASNTVAYVFPDQGKYQVVLGGTAGDMEVYYGKVFCQPKPAPINVARSWKFDNMPTDWAADWTKIQQVAGNGYWAESSKGRYSYAKTLNDEAITFDGETPVAMFEGLFFTDAVENGILVCPANGATYRCAQLQSGFTTRIPQVAAGDTIKLVLCNTEKSDVEGGMTFANALDVEGNSVESITTPASTYTEFVFVAEEDGDFTFKVAKKGVRLQTINVIPEGTVPTGIADVNSNLNTANGMFNLRGQKVSSTRTGDIYILNGKKYIAK
ncbi:MAG: Ig-like domain-containing protein [Prevotellaceae bacterium]|nr:Ig-like domain-containing protein [Prevotellaceae bacterium]